jgi:hypothetical protein
LALAFCSAAKSVARFAKVTPNESFATSNIATE